MPELQPGDYYLENGLLVFTAAYHVRRGTCCGNRCRHCPYEHANVPHPSSTATATEDVVDAREDGTLRASIP